ncbi:methyltransferase domain-containing protein [Methylobacterium sp. NEAU 140]|uniref:class I SAM-dependent methyltransferase n=1 Tax=Methylobacterium sp. NEAU 140 TaxID=3064945 RepID=UPI002733305F|nr:methyltransferase domain-containing protein [Methylobacterium sp. NEAU 140]MDP4024398.1 methyltransferase domain-containing protein [Methylobacterium sp. NEAU 140]
MNIYTSGAYMARNATWHVEDSPWKAEQVRTMLGRHGIVPRTLCEVGCGAGEVLVRLGETFPAARLQGFEVSQQALALARTRTRDGLTFTGADAFASGLHFDVALALDVMEHVEDYIAFARRMRPLAEHKIFHVPLDMNALAVARGWPIAHAREKVGHLHYFSKETALATLAQADHEIVDWAYTATALETPGAVRNAKAALLNVARRGLYALRPDAAAALLGGYSLLVLTR